MKRHVVVAALGTTQTLAWGSSYYLPAILAEPIAGALGLTRYGARSLLGIVVVVGGPRPGCWSGDRQPWRPRRSGPL
jgi:hypothetical protein